MNNTVVIALMIVFEVEIFSHSPRIDILKISIKKDDVLEYLMLSTLLIISNTLFKYSRDK